MQMNFLTTQYQTNIEVIAKNEKSCVVTIYRRNRFKCAFIYPFSFEKVSENENGEANILKEIAKEMIFVKNEYDSLFIL